jgi:hypothetical protein
MEINQDRGELIMSTQATMPDISLLEPDFPDGYIAGLPGELADIQIKDTISRQNRGEEDIPFGCAVTDGDGWPGVGLQPPNHDVGCKLFTGEGRVIGFAKSEYGFTAAGTNPCTGTMTIGSYQPGHTVQVIRDGRMRQMADGEVHPGDPVKVNDHGVVSVNGGHEVPGCTWETHSAQYRMGIIQILIAGFAPAEED